MTNGDRIRAMTDEELASWMYCFAESLVYALGEEYTIGREHSEDAIKWLQQEED